MSTNPCLDVLDRDAMRGNRRGELLCCTSESIEEEALLEPTFPEPKTTASYNPDARYAVGLSAECLSKCDGKDIDRLLSLPDTEVRKPTVLPPAPDSTHYALSGVISIPEESKQSGEWLKDVLDEHSVAVSLNPLNLRDAEILNRFFHVVTSMVTLSTLFLTNSFT